MFASVVQLKRVIEGVKVFKENVDSSNTLRKYRAEVILYVENSSRDSSYSILAQVVIADVLS